MEGATADQLPGSVGKKWVISPSKEEESVQRWIDAFQVCKLNPQSCPHAHASVRQVLLFSNPVCEPGHCRYASCFVCHIHTLL